MEHTDISPNSTLDGHPDSAASNRLRRDETLVAEQLNEASSSHEECDKGPIIVLSQDLSDEDDGPAEVEVSDFSKRNYTERMMAAEDNLSLEVNFSDAESCRVSDVDSQCWNVTQEDLSGIDLDSTAPASEAKDSSSDSTSADGGDLENLDDLDDCLEAELRLREMAGGELSEDAEPQEMTKSDETVCDLLVEDKKPEESSGTIEEEKATESDDTKIVDVIRLGEVLLDQGKTAVQKISPRAERRAQNLVSVNGSEVNQQADNNQQSNSRNTGTEKTTDGKEVINYSSGTNEGCGGASSIPGDKYILSDTSAPTLINGNNAVIESDDSDYLPPIPPVGWRHSNGLVTRHHKFIESQDHTYNNNNNGQGWSETVGTLPHVHQGDFISRKLSSEDGNYVTLDFSRSFFPRMVHRPNTRKSDKMFSSGAVPDAVATNSSNEPCVEANGRVDLGLPIQKNYSEMIDARIVSAALGGSSSYATVRVNQDEHVPSIGKLLGMSPMQPTRNHNGYDLTGVETAAACQIERKVLTPHEESSTSFPNVASASSKEIEADANVPSKHFPVNNLSGKSNADPVAVKERVTIGDKVSDGVPPSGVGIGEKDGRTFSLSSEPTECVDGADIISVMSDEGDKLSPVGMPSVEDGLSDNEDDSERVTGKVAIKRIAGIDGHDQRVHKNKHQSEDVIVKKLVVNGIKEIVDDECDTNRGGALWEQRGSNLTDIPTLLSDPNTIEPSDAVKDCDEPTTNQETAVSEDRLVIEEKNASPVDNELSDTAIGEKAEDVAAISSTVISPFTAPLPSPPPPPPPPPVDVISSDSAADKDAKVEEFAVTPIDRNAQVDKARLPRAFDGERESWSPLQYDGDESSEPVLIEGVLFRGRYLGSTQLISEGQPSKAMRMMQAQEAIGRIKEQPVGDAESHPPSTLVDLFVSVEKIMVLNTDLQEIMMDHALRTISYIADIGDVLVIMARRGPVETSPPHSSSHKAAATAPGAAGGGQQTGGANGGNQSAAAHSVPSQLSQTKICCHVFESDEAQLIAQSISQAFQVAYMEFLKANGINDPHLMKEMDYQDVLGQQEIFEEELFLFSNKDMQKEVIITKSKAEPLGVVIVESGWGSMVPTVVLANLQPGGAAARCGQLNIGDQIMMVNGVSLVGLALSTCQSYIRAARNDIMVRLLVVACTPVVEVLVKRPDIKYQLGFSVQNGVICSLLRGGIAERGGVRVGHRIIEINGQSVVAVPHEKIVSMLASSVGEIHMKTMQTSIYRLLTGQDVPHYI